MAIMYKSEMLLYTWFFSNIIMEVGLRGVLASENGINGQNNTSRSPKYFGMTPQEYIYCSNYTGRQAPKSQPDNRTKIHIGILLPFNFTSHVNEFSAGSAKWYSEAANIAIERINNNPSLLPGHKLEFVISETNCNELNNTKAMYYQYRKRNLQNLPIHGFIGLGCECRTAAKFASAMKVPVVSHMCSSRELSNKKLFPTFARTFTLADVVNPAIKLFLRTYNWTEVGVIYSKDSSRYKETSTELLHALKGFVSYKFAMDTIRYKEEFGSIIPGLKKKARVVILYMEYRIAFDFLLAAHKAQMNNRDVLFIIVELEPDIFRNRRRYPFKLLDGAGSNNQDKNVAKEMLKHAVIFVQKAPNLKSEYLTELKCRQTMSPLSPASYYGMVKRIPVPHQNIYLYDAVQVLSIALNKTLRLKQSIEDGMKVVENMKGITFSSINGNTRTMDDSLNSREPYSLVAYTYEGDVFTFTETGYYNGVPLKYVKVREIPWFDGRPPAPGPFCGLRNELCPTKPITEELSLEKIVAISVSVTVIGVILLLLPIFLYRQFRLERELTSKLWKVSVTDLAFVNRHSSSKSTLTVSQTSIDSLESDTFLMTTARDDQVFGKQSEIRTTIAIFKGTYVAVKVKRKRAVELNRDVLLELKQMRDMRHDNVNQFIGASIESDRVLIVTQYALRGSLEDVLMDSSIKLETLFLLSLIYDIVKGMIYLHGSEIKSHGNLKSSNCVIDSRWVLKIADFGLHSFRDKSFEPMDERNTSLKHYLWQAPELLRMSNPPARGTEKGDVYSFAIILQECHTRKGPWSGTCLAHKEILKRIMAPELPPFRPTVSELIENAEELRDIMKKCWLEHPDARPTFHELCKGIDSLIKANGFKRNIVDNMVYMMERYTDHLEDLVEQKTGELICEKRRIETLLERMLPASVARQLKLGKEVEAETFKHVSIYFSDIVGFTELCADSTPMQVVKLLNDLYTLFDSIIKGYNVYKVETIGDAYMVVSGLPIRNEREHASEIALMALHINSSIKRFKIHHRPNASLNLRIGINSGPVVAGVVGTAMPRYCLFGDTVNTASRMESTGAASKIHISESTKNALEVVGGFVVQKRGTTFCKGKGEILTFWLEDTSAEFQSRIEEHDKSLKFDQSHGSQLSLDIFSRMPTPTRTHGSHLPGLLRNSPDSTPLQLRRAMFLKNIKKNGEKVTSLDVPDSDSAPLLNRLTHSSEVIVT